MDKKEDKKITNQEISNFKRLVIEELQRLGADEQDYILISDQLIQNALLQNWKAEDVAWAIIQ